MLQPVVPYAITGLALGSLLKRPGAGAIIGSLVGVANTTSKKQAMGRLGFGLAADAPVAMAHGTQRASKGKPPNIALTLENAKIAVGYAVKWDFPKENKGWTPYDIGVRWDKAPWRHYSTPKGVLFEGNDYLQKKGSSSSSRGRRYLKKVKDATLKKPLSMREWTQKYKGDLFGSKKQKKRSGRGRRAPVQGPREDTDSFISPSGAAGGEQWWKTGKGKIGIAALAGTGALVLILLMTRR
jgi:hypothetical protein